MQVFFIFSVRKAENFAEASGSLYKRGHTICSDG